MNGAAPFIQGCCVMLTFANCIIVRTTETRKTCCLFLFSVCILPFTPTNPATFKSIGIRSTEKKRRATTKSTILQIRRYTLQCRVLASYVQIIVISLFYFCTVVNQLVSKLDRCLEKTSRQNNCHGASERVSGLSLDNVFQNSFFGPFRRT